MKYCLRIFPVLIPYCICKTHSNILYNRVWCVWDSAVGREPVISGFNNKTVIHLVESTHKSLQVLGMVRVHPQLSYTELHSLSVVAEKHKNYGLSPRRNT